MMIDRTRFAVVLIGDRLCACVVRGSRVEAFVVESEQPAAALRAELDSRQVSPRSVAIGLPRGVVTVKPVDLPVLGADTREMVRFELERHLPFPADDAFFDFLPLPSDDTGADGEVGRRVLVAAADRRVVDMALRIVQDAKLRPVSVTVAAHDLLTLTRLPSNHRVVWAHRTGDTIDLLFVTDGALVLSRTMPAVDDAALATEIRRTFSVVKWDGCDAVWISGDAAAPAVATASPLADLGAPVTAPAYTVAARRALGAIEGAPRGALELALAVALAPGVRPLDLLPASLRPFSLTRAQKITAAAAAAAAVIVVAASMVPGYRDGVRLAAINSEIASLDNEVRAVERMLRELESKRALVNTIDGLNASAIRPLPVLRELTELLPNDAWLTLVSLEAKGVELTGQANAASGLIPLLENSPRFERVEFASPVTRGRDREQFRIQAAWEQRAAEPPRSAAATPGVQRPPAPTPPASIESDGPLPGTNPSPVPAPGRVRPR
jgi:general secretion pathway protein L